MVNYRLSFLHRLQDVENRLKETAREFEESRLKAKSARENFLAIKRKRMERFSRAFNHITENIDRIYKELTKNKVHPVGGTAYLTLENSEVSIKMYKTSHH
jgi:structural maintenance of chromosome 1